nr:PXMP2/4 family protein 4-like [Tanacetum cinerariifolium]
MFRRHPISSNPIGSPLTRPGFKAAPYSRFTERKVKDIEFTVPFGGGTKNGVASYGGFIGWYMDMLKTRPVLTKSVTSGLIYIIADFSSQTITRSSSDSYDANNVRDKGKSNNEKADTYKNNRYGWNGVENRRQEYRKKQVETSNSQYSMNSCRIILSWNPASVKMHELYMHKRVSGDYPWDLLGDLNVTLNIEEHSSGGSFITDEMREFKDCINLIEVENIGRIMIGKKNGNNIWSAVRRISLAAVVYYIWHERNHSIFRGEKSDANGLIDTITETIKLKLMSLKVKESSARTLDAHQACREDNTVSLVMNFTSGPSSGVRAAHSRDRQNLPNLGLICMCVVLTRNRWCVFLFILSFSFFLLFGYPPFESFAMLLEESDDLNIPDAAPVDPILEAGALPKFDMHLYKSSLNESHVRYLAKLHGIPVELHSRVVPEGNWFSFQKPYLKGSPTSLKKWKDKFFLVNRRAAPIAMAWRHHDFSVADPLPRPSEYNASDVAKPREIVISFHRPPLSILYVVGLSNVWKRRPCVFYKGFGGEGFCWGSSSPGTVKVTNLAPLAGRLEDIPPKTGDMMVAEMPCRKVLDDKEKKKRKAEEKTAARAPAANVQVDAAANKGADKEGPRKKRRAKPLEALAHEEHTSPPLSVGRMDTLRDQTDEHATSPRVDEEGQGNADASHAIEGHGDNEGGLSGLQTRPSPAHHSGRRLDILEEPTHSNIVPDVEASYSAGRFGNLPFTPQWGLTESSRMDNSSLQDRLEELEEEKREADQLNSSQADRIKQLEEALKHLAIGKGFMDGISIGREDADVRAILQATPNVDPASSDIFMDAYEKLFDQRYPYVDKVARMYLLDPSGLQNIMLDETGPTPGGGPRDTPRASYA